jgi:hypothetical protein
MFKYILGFVLGIGVILSTVFFLTHKTDSSSKGIPMEILAQHKKIATQARETVYAPNVTRISDAEIDDHEREAQPEVQPEDQAEAQPDALADAQPEPLAVAQSEARVDATNSATAKSEDDEISAEIDALPGISSHPEAEDVQDDSTEIDTKPENQTASLDNETTLPLDEEQDELSARILQETTEPAPVEMFAKSVPEDVAPSVTPSSAKQATQSSDDVAPDSGPLDHALLPDELPEIAELRAVFSSQNSQEQPPPPVLDAWVYAKSFNTRGQAEGFARVIAKHSGVDLDVFERGFATYLVGIRLEQGAELDPVLKRINSQENRPAPLIMHRADFQLLDNDS